MKMRIVNEVGCSIDGDFTEEELEKFKKVGWKVE
jgi:hypothetical protein